MKKIQIHANLRKISTKGQLKKIRADGYIPAIYYSTFDGSIPIAVKKDEFHKRTRGVSLRGKIIELIIDEMNLSKPALIREIQRAHTSDEIIHIDFQGISLKEKVEVDIPIKFTGQAQGVLEVMLRELKVRCIPTKIPECVEIDISGFGVGERIGVDAIKKILREVEILTPADTIIAVIAAPIEEAVPTAPTVIEPEVISKKKEEKPVEGE